MGKAKHQVGISTVLLQFIILNIGLFGVCALLWGASVTIFQQLGVIHYANYGEQQAQQFIKLQQNKEVFEWSKELKNVHYLLVDTDGHILKSSGSKKQIQLLKKQVKNKKTILNNILIYEYPDNTRLFISYPFVVTYANDTARKYLPKYEVLSLVLLFLAMIACLLFSTHVFKKRIMKELRLIRQTSQQITQKNLETTMPQMKIKEFAQVIETLDLMQHTLKASLTKQWQEEQIRQNEIAALAHDLKTPITLIKGNAELLLEDELTEEQTEMTKTILQSSQQSKEYVDVMLATSIGQEEKFQWISSAQFVEEYLNPFLSNQSRVSVYLEKIGAQTINIQPLRIQRAVMNVANNALEYTAPSCKVTVKCRLDDSKGLKITIQDTGPGFSQEGLIHATDRFWKEDKARKLDGHQGLGLWFVKQVAQEHDGELTIENTLLGAKVTIYLPTPIVKLS